METLTSTQLWLLLIAVAGVAFILGRATAGGANAEDRAAREMRERQEAERLFAAMPPDAQQDVDALIADGQTIEAVKKVREHSGAGLREAKSAVDVRRTTMGAA